MHGKDPIITRAMIRLNWEIEVFYPGRMAGVDAWISSLHQRKRSMPDFVSRTFVIEYFNISVRDSFVSIIDHYGSVHSFIFKGSILICIGNTNRLCPSICFLFNVSILICIGNTNRLCSNLAFFLDFK